MNNWYHIWAEDIDWMRVSCVNFVFLQEIKQEICRRGGYWMNYWYHI